MMSSPSLRSISALAIALAAIPSGASAAPAAPTTTSAPTTTASAEPEVALAPEPPPSDHDRHMMGARFSTKRLLAEILAGAVVGSIAAYATFSATCDDGSDCFGASLMSAGVSFAVTPLAIWGAGRWGGGEGSLGWSYLGASVALASFSATGSADESTEDALSRFKLELAISTILLPITSALTFELSSHLRYKQWLAGHPTSLQLGVVPTYDHRGGVDGAMGQVSLRF